MLEQCGRNFEYLSGEDGGALGAVMAAAVVTGVQSQGVIANAKHYVQVSSSLPLSARERRATPYAPAGGQYGKIHAASGKIQTLGQL